MRQRTIPALLVLLALAACGEERSPWAARSGGCIRSRSEPWNTESYDEIVDNPFLRVSDEPLSTFAVDVDTASYSNVRRFLRSGRLPPKGAVRIEELLNYFPYAYERPAVGETFAVDAEVVECPWAASHQLVRLGLKAAEPSGGRRPPCNLVFLVDVSGSMGAADKLPLVKRSLRLLATRLRHEDRVAIVVYAGSAGLVLPSTPGSESQEILAAVEALRAKGSTNAGHGIQLAYATALAGYRLGGMNRVILATDGDFNVGTTSRSELTHLVREKAAKGVFLTVLGFGTGNLDDAVLEQLADRGNGAYAYIDSVKEARRVLAEQMGGTLITVAKDVKVQVEFNPEQVEAYRLLGYENRLLAARDFNDDAKDAGEVGAGHAVTAIYEIVPQGVAAPGPRVDALRYQDPLRPREAAGDGELLHVKVRYKQPDGDRSQVTSLPVPAGVRPFRDASPDCRFAASVAAFGMLLRGSEHAGTADYRSVLTWSTAALDEDRGGWRAAFLDLVRLAMALAR